MKPRWPILWIDADNRLREMALGIQAIEKERVIPLTIDVPLIEDRLRGLHSATQTVGQKGFVTKGQPKQQPKGYLQFLDYMDAADALIKQHSIRTVVLDPVTRIEEHLARFLQYQTRKGTIEESGWGIYLSNWEEIFNELLAFKKLGCSVVATFHDKDYYDADTEKRLGTKPLIRGQIQSKVGSYFAEVWYTFQKKFDGRPKWHVRTKPDDFTACRTSKPLDEIEDSYLPAILEKGGWKDDEPLTLMLFGSYGSGKTTLILSLCDVEEEVTECNTPAAGKDATTLVTT